MNDLSSQEFESYVPVYDTVPEGWSDARPFLVEVLKKITNAVNLRVIGWYLDEELLSGKAFIPSETPPGNETPALFRQILRKVVDVGPLVLGLNPGVPHGIVVDNRFTLIITYVSGTNSVTLKSQTISGNSVEIDSVNIVITSPQAFDRAFCVIEYIQEL